MVTGTEVLARRTQMSQETIRGYRLSEADLAATLRLAGRDITGFDDLEITTCLSLGELEMGDPLRRIGRNCIHGDIAVSTSGVAGPGGGTEAKPVGTVCCAIASTGHRTVTRTLQLSGDRASVRALSTTAAMHTLADALETHPTEGCIDRAGRIEHVVTGRQL